MLTLSIEFAFAAILVAQYAVVPLYAQLHDRQFNAANANQSASSLVEESIRALGGRQALEALQSVTYESDRRFRVHTLAQNYNLFETDRAVVTSGSQNVSFSFTNSGYSQRIDRSFVSSDYWVFVTPELLPRDFSLVARSGTDGFVCLVKSSNTVLFPQELTMGYLDSAMTEYLLLQALKLSPKLLIEVQTHNPELTEITFRESAYPAVHDDHLNLTIAFDPESHLPFLVRSFEDHPIFGPVGKDLQLYSYTEVEGILFPQQQKTLYREDFVLEHTAISRIHVNSTFEPGFFDGLGPDETDTVPAPPQPIEGYGHALLGEWWSNTMWPGLYQGTYGAASATLPAADLPGAHRLEFMDGPVMAQLVLEFEESVIVFEAPPHQTKLVIQWVKETLDKPISHVYLSHHHHDHSFAVTSYVELGASVIVPEVAASYWEQIPGINLLTFTEDQPYIHSDGNMQARFIWHPNTPHSADWTYAIVTSACPDADTSMLAFTADAISEGTIFDSLVGTSWLLQAMDDRASINTTIVPAHGDTRPLSDIFELLGSPYPKYNSTSFIRGGKICLE